MECGDEHGGVKWSYPFERRIATGGNRDALPARSTNEARSVSAVLPAGLDECFLSAHVRRRQRRSAHRRTRGRSAMAGGATHAWVKSG
jgi:hypothetical protein